MPTAGLTRQDRSLCRGGQCGELPWGPRTTTGRKLEARLLEVVAVNGAAGGGPTLLAVDGAPRAGGRRHEGSGGSAESESDSVHRPV